MNPRKFEIACIIDDDDIFIYGIKRLIELKKLCKSLLIFPNGKQALDFFQDYLPNVSAVPDLILLDMNMPVVDGWQFLESFAAIKARYPKPLTIFMVSSSINATDIENARKLSILSGYLIKPITLEDLVLLFSGQLEGCYGNKSI
ncbi:MAG: response regulator [Bacteroidia bacterium]